MPVAQAYPAILTSWWSTPVTLSRMSSKFWRTIWPPAAESEDFKPYMENSRQSQNSQWDQGQWQPSDWSTQRPQLLQDLYNANIIRDQEIDHDIPVLEVGQGFYMLGGEDKRRVVRYLDSAYNITASRADGIIILRDAKTDEDIGIYSASGLQLQ